MPRRRPSVSCNILNGQQTGVTRFARKLSGRKETAARPGPTGDSSSEAPTPSAAATSANADSPLVCACDTPMGHVRRKTMPATERNRMYLSLPPHFRTITRIGDRHPPTHIPTSHFRDLTYPDAMNPQHVRTGYCVHNSFCYNALYRSYIPHCGRDYSLKRDGCPRKSVNQL